MKTMFLRVLPCFLIGVVLITAGCDRAADQAAPPNKPVVPQVARDSVLALKKLEARTQAGISYDDYLRALGDTKFAVNLFLDSQDSKKFSELAEAVRKAMSDYQFAGETWKLRLDKTIQPRDSGVRGAVRLSDAEGQEIVSKLPGANKPISGELLKQWKANELVYAKQFLRVASATDQIKPLQPRGDDGAVYEQKGYPDARSIGDKIFIPKGAKEEMIPYLDLEIVFRLLWLRAGEALAKAYGFVA